MIAEKNNYRIVKLVSGENIICEQMEGTNELKVRHPLKMDVVTHMTNKGIAESLNLSRWLQPFSDQRVYTINTDHVILVANVSIGLGKYYEHVLRKIEDIELPQTVELEPTDQELLEEVLEEYDLDPDTDTIH